MVGTLYSEENGALDRALEEADRREREMGSVASGEKRDAWRPERAAKVLDVPRALDRVVRREIDAASAPVRSALLRLLPERAEDHVALHGVVERQVEPAGTLQARLRLPHPALVESDDVRKVRDRLEEGKNRTLRILAPRAAGAAREPHDGRSRVRGRRLQPDERELDHRAARPRPVLEDGQVTQLRGDRQSSVSGCEPDRLEAQSARRRHRVSGWRGLREEGSGGR